MSFGWEPINFILGPMIGLVPLLASEARCSQYGKPWRKWRVFGLSYLFFAVYNFGTIWWAGNASPIAVIASVIVNSLFFALVFTLFSSTKKYLGDKLGYLSLLVYWIAWEYIELLDWDLSWPWMTLGYSLSGFPKLIQWYEFSGSLGGSLWLLIINLMVFFFWKILVNNNIDPYLKFRRGLFILYVISIPIISSFVIYYFIDESKLEKIDVVVVQPNKDAYSGQYLNKKLKPLNLYGINRAHHLLNLGFKKVDDNVDYIFYPETAFSFKIKNKNFQSSPEVKLFQTVLEKYPNLNMVTGINYKEDVKDCDKRNLPFDASISKDGICFKNYNSAIQLSKGNDIQLYHKSRLVIGVERIPKYFTPLEKYLVGFSEEENESYYTTNHGTQKDRSVFKSKKSVSVAPIICYESIFGEYVNGYVKKGAQFLSIITNDGWWEDTPGYKQHWGYARLRAIETRRSIARSANTGRSGFINIKGEDLITTNWMEPAVLRSEISLNNEITFYVKYGDVLGRGLLAFSILLILNLIIRILKKDAIV